MTERVGDGTGRPTVAVIGGGISGLAAALAIADGAPGALDILVLEQSSRLGGRIHTAEMWGRRVDLGPDAFIARAPEGIELCARLGLADELVAPATAKAYVWLAQGLVAMPRGLLLGVPGRLGPLARSGILSRRGLARAALDLVLPRGSPPAADRSVGDLVGRRLGPEVLERLVGPIVGGINAGSAGDLSLAAVAPQLDDLARGSRSLILGARRSIAKSAQHPGPVFLTHPRGLGHIVECLAAELVRLGVEVRTQWGVKSMQRSAGRFELSSGSAVLAADAVVVALPASGAACLLREVCAAAAAEIAATSEADVSIATLCYARDCVRRDLDGAGYLVPATSGRLTTACTWSSTKWPHLAAQGEVLLRISAGRCGDGRHLRLDDDALVGALHAEAAEALGLNAPPLHCAVTRWPASFPQYTVGHRDRMARAEASVAGVPGLALAGSYYGGIGIPACIRQARRAAASVLSHLARDAGVARA